MSELIDLNSATAEQLDDIEELQGHGFEIVRSRTERGRFSSFRVLNEAPGLAGKVPDAGLDVLTIFKLIGS